jgi:hypothetical protein
MSSLLDAGNRRGSEQNLENVDTKEVKALDKELPPMDIRLWALTGPDIALSYADNLRKSLFRTISLFETDHTTEAQILLEKCLEGAERFQETITITKTALNIDFDSYRVGETKLSEIDKRLGSVMSTVVQASKERAWLGLSETIEDEFITSLGAWIQALEQLKRTTKDSSAG